MLKSIYDTLDAIPEGERTHYALHDGKYVLQLDEHHPVAKKNAELLREKSADKGTITRLTNEKATLEATALPAGHVAIPAADAQLLSAYKAHGKPEDFETAVKERNALKTENETAKRAQLLHDVAGAEGWPVELFEMPALNLEYELRDVQVDGKTAKRAFVLVKNGERVEAKPFEEYAETDEKVKALLPLVESSRQQVSQPGTRYVKQPGAKSQLPATKEEAVKAERARLAASNQYSI